jgi:predicted transcriptional regulator of viral defense system
MFTKPQHPRLELHIYALARRAKHAVFSIQEAHSWELCSPGTLRVTLGRMQKRGVLVRLKRGLYYAPPAEQSGVPAEDAMYAAQMVYGGYLAFATALYIHRLRDEVPWTIFVATRGRSAARRLGALEIRSVALRDRAIGVQRIGDYMVSTRPKTLYDCLRLPEMGGGEVGVAKAFRRARLSGTEWREFWAYVGRFERGNERFGRRLRRVLKMAGVKMTSVKDAGPKKTVFGGRRR